MRPLLAPVFWLGRVLLWIVFLPVGIWRSLSHHRKKESRKTLKKVERMMEERERR
jgi:hypothetical protein